jgi:ribosomal protein L9
METLQEYDPRGFEKIKEYLQEASQILKESAIWHKEFEREMKESVERHKEFEKEMKESAERHKEFEKEMKESKAEFNERLGNYINLFGDFTEYTMAPKMCEKFLEFGFDFHKTNRRITVRDSKNDMFFEVDVMLENGDTAMLVEIKTELTIDRIKKHISRLEKMRKYADLRGDKRVFLGAVAGVILDDDTRNYALDQGFYLIEPAGQDLNITPPNGKPKEW